MSMPICPPRSTVLLVDDDEMLCRMLARALDDSDLHVLLAGNGKEGLGLVRKHGNALGLIVTDISMPVMNGLEFARAFRPLHPSIPLLFMTGALPAFSGGISLREVGARLLLKPFSPDVFTDVVNAMVAEGPSARRTFA